MPGVRRETRKASALDNLWRSMRGLKSFTPTDLAAHSTVPGILVSRDEAQAYCRALLGARYLRVMRKAVPGRREAIYRLVRDTGPKPPRERRVRALADENVGEMILLEGGAA